jgi:regulator of cell morphogenesis and NO signaling
VKNATTIPGDVTVNEAIRLWPASVAVFQKFNIDSCCGGALPIREAAAHHGIDVDTLLAALAPVVEAATTS